MPPDSDPMLQPDTRYSGIPHIVSWNITKRCVLRCPHCYIDAGTYGDTEISTSQARNVIDELRSVGKPVIILSGGEPLLREDILEIIRYGSRRGVRMVMGSCGVLITAEIAGSLFEAGLRKVAISLDSDSPGFHDRFRGVNGAWVKATGGIRAAVDAGLGVQINTTVTRENYRNIPGIIRFGSNMGIKDFQVFFLVPTGRGSALEDVTPEMYETMIREVLQIAASGDLNIRPTCAPQFMRISRQMDISRPGWGRGCLAGTSYCRVTTSGDITPCPYLPISCGNILKQPFREIWYGSKVLKDLRDSSALKGKCGVCNYKCICGGCRARAFGLSYPEPSGRLVQPGDVADEYLDEDPWCTYVPPEFRSVA